MLQFFDSPKLWFCFSFSIYVTPIWRTMFWIFPKLVSRDVKWGADNRQSSKPLLLIVQFGIFLSVYFRNRKSCAKPLPQWGLVHSLGKNLRDTKYHNILPSLSLAVWPFLKNRSSLVLIQFTTNLILMRFDDVWIPRNQHSRIYIRNVCLVPRSDGETLQSRACSALF